MSFADRKARILAEIDRSPKGSWDARIVALLNWINDQPGIVTTSSCSGRVALYRSPAEGSQKAGSWLFVSHDPVAVDEVWDALSADDVGSTALICEGFVLHTDCENTEVGMRLVRAAQSVGCHASTFLSSLAVCQI